MGIKMVHHICIQTEDYKESLDFYTKILGFEVVSETPNFHTRDYNTWIRLGDFMIELQTPKSGDKFNKWSSLNGGPVHMAFLVDNVEEEYKRIIELGYNNFKLKNGQVVYKVEGESLFKIKAPEGTEIEIRDTDIN
ncbi:VOC family protein [[Clostridium] dakarense]|uniref:VOC family protein n=1 Tax=Faecalimicrobium dakarense TaxID=1301100 RepID=UPI0004B26C85|nr:VOC family protein [[Clostridium] dakarense]